MEKISYNFFKKLQMKVATIKSVSRIPNTDKLYKLQVDLGDSNIQIVSSLVPYYSEEELLNKTIIVLVNLEPTKLHGEVSEGMLLCAEKEDESECVLLTTESEIANGTLIT